MVIAVVALFVALGGGATAGVLITGAQIKNNALRTQDVRNGSLLAENFKAGQLPAGAAGPAEPAGTARAYAQIVNQGGGSFLAERTKGFTGLTRPSTAVYCLTIDPALGIDPATVAEVASVEFGNTTGSNVGYAWPRGASTSSCPAGNFAVHTFVLTAGALVTSNAVAFNIIVP
jgi:hypothetical protein